MVVLSRVLRAVLRCGHHVRHGARGGWYRYTAWLDRNGWRAQAINTSVLMGTGDVLAQLVVERRSPKDFDKTRCLRFFGCGLCVFGPSMFVWYTSLDRIVKGATTLRVAVQKMMLDQCLFLPLYVAVYISLMDCLRGKNRTEIREKLRRDYKPVMITSYQLWPAVQIANFYYIPLKHRILVMNCVGLLWNTYIGWKSEQQHVKTPTVKTAAEESESQVVAKRTPAKLLNRDARRAYCTAQNDDA